MSNLSLNKELLSLKVFSLLFISIFFFNCEPTIVEEDIKEIVLEQHRSKFHFTPPEKWMNDPNGMVYYDGEYHLFYQYFPDSTVWGPMHWGHAVSRDLVSWEHLPIALYPDSLGYIFSGSAVIDWKNTSGFGVDNQPPMIAIFTYHEPEKAKAGDIDFQYQAIAYSNDKGRSWTKYEGNPVIPNPGIRDFRDPKVIWDEDSNQWLMVFAAWDLVKFYGSPDLKNWTHLSDFGQEWGAHGGVWECPDIFPMTVEGSEEKKWVLLQSLNPGSANGGSGTQYFIGDFDGTNFNLEERFAQTLNGQENPFWLDYGRDNYAGVTWSDVPKEDGRRLFMGWMSNWDYAQIVPTESWRSAMTLPRELVLKQTPEGYRIFSKPVEELMKLRLTSHLINAPLSGELALEENFDFSHNIFEIVVDATITNDSKPDFGIKFYNAKGEQYLVGYNAENNQFYSDRRKAGKIDFSPKFAEKVHTAPRILNDNQIKMHLFLDVASGELFADDGQVVMTDIFFPNEDFSKLKLYALNGSVQLNKVEIYELKSVAAL